MCFLKELLAKLKSTNKINKEYYDKVNEFIKLNRQQLVDNIKEIFAKFKNRTNLVNAWQAHEKNDDKHLFAHRDIENNKSKNGARFYNDLLQVLKNQKGKGGAPGMFGGF